jgi:hypothetical protein
MKDDFSYFLLQKNHKANKINLLEVVTIKNLFGRSLDRKTLREDKK